MGKENNQFEKGKGGNNKGCEARLKIFNIDPPPPPTFLTQSHFSLHLSMRYPVMVIIIIR